MMKVFLMVLFLLNWSNAESIGRMPYLDVDDSMKVMRHYCGQDEIRDILLIDCPGLAEATLNSILDGTYKQAYKFQLADIKTACCKRKCSRLYMRAYCAIENLTPKNIKAEDTAECGINCKYVLFHGMQFFGRHRVVVKSLSAEFTTPSPPAYS